MLKNVKIFLNKIFSYNMSCLLLFPGIISGIIISALGACKTSILGTLLMSIGMVTSGFVTSSYLLYVTYGLTAGR